MTSDPARNAARIAARAAAELEARLAEPLAPGLYLVATPIGNLGDVTLRALAILAGAGSLYCEDTRQSRKLLERYGIERQLGTYHEHNADEVRPRILAELAAGRSVALVSDAGTPLVSDPGYKLVRASAEAGHAVFGIPGPSAVLAALSPSALPTDSFHFAGFLPHKPKARRDRIAALAEVPGTLVLFEAPSRIAAALADLAAGLGARPAAIARELTKLHEEVRRGTLPELAAWADTASLKGEIVVVVGPPPERDVSDGQIVAALEPRLASGSLRDAAATVASALGVSRARVYNLALGLRRGERPCGPDDKLDGKLDGRPGCGPDED